MDLLGGFLLPNRWRPNRTLMYSDPTVGMTGVGRSPISHQMAIGSSLPCTISSEATVFVKQPLPLAIGVKRDLRARLFIGSVVHGLFLYVCRTFRARIDQQRNPRQDRCRPANPAHKAAVTKVATVGSLDIITLSPPVAVLTRLLRTKACKSTQL